MYISHAAILQQKIASEKYIMQYIHVSPYTMCLYSNQEIQQSRSIVICFSIECLFWNEANCVCSSQEKFIEQENVEPVNIRLKCAIDSCLRNLLTKLNSRSMLKNITRSYVDVPGWKRERVFYDDFLLVERLFNAESALHGSCYLFN